MSEIKKTVGTLILFCIIAAAVFKAVDWVIPSPPIKYYICIEDNEGEYKCDSPETPTGGE